MSSKIFDKVQVKAPQQSTFDLTHDVKLSCNFGHLVPILCSECIPGDKWKIGCDSLTRLAPLVYPMMHRVDVTMHYFFVPNRILWDNWEYYIANQKTPAGDDIAFPVIQAKEASYSPLMDYLGVPPPIGSEVEVINALPFAAYQKIYNEYYRDQNLQELVSDKLEDGTNDYKLYNALRTRAWEHDYLTSALPFAQKGSSVEIPLGNVVYNNEENHPQFWHQADGGGDALVGNAATGFIIGGGTTMTANGNNEPINMDPNGTLEVSPTTITQLRTAFKLQEWLERAARGGTRYTEFIKSFFNVDTGDARVQRPEYITGVKSPIVISEVLNMTGTEQSPQGSMAGHGVSVNQGQMGSYYCREHGYIIGIMSVMPKTAYMDGLPKHFLKINSPFDYFFEQFQHIGEQEILNKEVYAYQGATGNETFGYIPRYSEYKYENNRVAGQFRNTLDAWHMARKFAAPPALNSDFITCNPTYRVFAVEDPHEDHLFIQVLNKLTVTRPMSYYGNPSTF